MTSIQNKNKDLHLAAGSSKKSLPMKKRKIREIETSQHIPKRSKVRQVLCKEPDQFTTNIFTRVASARSAPYTLNSRNEFFNSWSKQQIDQGVDWSKLRLVALNDFLLETKRQKSLLNDLENVMNGRIQVYKELINLHASARTNQMSSYLQQDQKREIHERTSFDTLWRQRFNELLQFTKEKGHANVPQRYEPNRALGKWVHKQRQEFKKKLNGEQSTLTVDRMKALQEIGFQSSLSNRAEALWNDRYNELIAFWKENGHCDVPQRYAPNRALGKWVHRQRFAFKNWCDGEPSSLTPERAAALLKVGFRFRVNKSSQRKMDVHNEGLENQKIQAFFGARSLNAKAS